MVIMVQVPRRGAGMEKEGLARRLRVLRAERDWGLLEAAKEIGISKNTLADAEHGRRMPNAPTLTKIAQTYDVPLASLFTDAPIEIEDVITFSPGAVEEVIRAHKAGKISQKDARIAIKDLVQGPGGALDEAIELLLSPARPTSDAPQTAGAAQR